MGGPLPHNDRAHRFSRTIAAAAAGLKPYEISDWTTRRGVNIGRTPRKRHRGAPTEDNRPTYTVADIVQLAVIRRLVDDGMRVATAYRVSAAFTEAHSGRLLRRGRTVLAIPEGSERAVCLWGGGASPMDIDLPEREKVMTPISYMCDRSSASFLILNRIVARVMRRLIAVLRQEHAAAG